MKRVSLFFLFVRYAGGSLPTLPRDLGNRFLDIVKLDDYQEPYQALKYAPYYSYSTVVMEMKDMMLNNKGSNINHSGMPCSVHGRPRCFACIHTYVRVPRACTHAYQPYIYTLVHVGPCARYELPLLRVRMYQTTKHSPDRNQYTVPLHSLLPTLPLFRARSSFAISSAAVYANGAVDTSYDYAVPELGTVPLLNQDSTGRGPAVSSGTSDQDSIFSKTSSRGNKTENKKVRIALTLLRVATSSNSIRVQSRRVKWMTLGSARC